MSGWSFWPDFMRQPRLEAEPPQLTPAEQIARAWRRVGDAMRGVLQRYTTETLTIQIAPDPAVPGEWVARVVEVPSVLDYGATPEEAARAAVTQAYEELDPVLQAQWDAEDSAVEDEPPSV